MLVGLALHHSRTVRSAALRVFSTLQVQHRISLLHSLQQWLRQDLPQALVTKPKAEDPVQPSEVAGRMHAVIVQVFETFVQSPDLKQRKSKQTGKAPESTLEGSNGVQQRIRANPPAEVLALTLQIACHPFVADFLRTHRNPWAQFQRLDPPRYRYLWHGVTLVNKHP